ncbi:alpha/beta fold hydrolase [Mycolicibacterium pyrenivorans]|uniref:alpha/beta fold hydrolase n=1 Tax=Mycolicibacterium pyrenivorans TaxID=187102 RepID=UPI0021F38581|nr:alpha/beta hydrolase [Mycolicibacterium pyrenivorans]MCV7152466.1 alpha/beta fold hydrolase [Mycolicibacterium pyrenivorans]
MRTMSRGFGIHYTVDGDGPPLMLVAGTMLAARHWADVGYVKALADRWRVINVDPLGHGGSDRPHDADSYTVDGVTADLCAVLDAEGAARATVWGYSRGGWLACGLASRHPQRVDGIVVGGYAMHAYREEVGRMLAPLAEHLRAGDWASLWRVFGVSDAAFMQMIEDGNDAPAVAAAVEGSMRPDRFIDPASIRCPAHFYVGADDWIVPHVHADVDSLVGATVDVIGGGTHLGTFFAEAQPVLSAVTARLSGPRSP